LAASSTCGVSKKATSNGGRLPLGGQARELIGAEHDRLGDAGAGFLLEGRRDDVAISLVPGARKGRRH